MKYNIVRDVLLDNKHITEITPDHNHEYQGKSYMYLIRCKIDVYGEFFPFVIGIPKDWEVSLFDFYIEGESMFIPHMDCLGKLCLFNLEGTLIDANFKGLFNQCVNKAREVIHDGVNGKNKDDFIAEFDSYFALLPNLRFARVSMPKDKSSQQIKVCKLESKGKGRGPIAIWRAHKKVKYFVSYKQEDFQFWDIRGTQANGVYLFIEPSERIYPPNYLDFNAIDFINLLFAWVDKKNFDKLNPKNDKSLFVVFEIKQPGEIINSCAFQINAPVFKDGNKIKLKECREIYPALIERIDLEVLSRRVSYTDNLLESKSILLIGAGSIGGYTLHNLIKAGCKNITIVDNDSLKHENIYRHILGARDVNRKKVEALKIYAEKSLPGVKIKPIGKSIQHAIDDKSVDLASYDYIVSASGNHNVNLWLNNYIKSNNIVSAVFYIWNEALDIGCHVALVKSDREYDYNNLFNRDKNGEMYDISSYVKKGQDVSKSYGGCTGTFIPYGASISLNSSMLFLNLLKKHVEGRISENVLCSEKGDDFYFNKAGFQKSMIYEMQKDKISMRPLSKIREGFNAT